MSQSEAVLPVSSIHRATILLASDRGSDKYMTMSKIAEAYPYHTHDRTDCPIFIL